MSMTAALGAFFLFASLDQGRLDPVATAKDGELFVNHYRICRLRTSSGSVSPAEQATLAAEVIQKVGKEGAAVVQLGGGLASIQIRGVNVLRISRDEASAQASDLKALADAWAASINNALDAAPVSFTSPELAAPAGGRVSVGMRGAGSTVAKFFVEKPEVLSIEPTEGRLWTTGISPGSTKVTAVYGDHSETLVVNVLPVAAKFPQTVSAKVVGSPASAETIQSAVTTAVQMQFEHVAGATVDVGTVGFSAVGAGGQRSWSVPVSVSADDHYPTRGMVSVLVQNLGVRHEAEELLWYSNNPENILEPSELYWGELKPNQPVRLLAHHYNKTSRPMVVHYIMFNEGEEDASVSVVMGDATPAKDPTKVGYQAGDVFFKNWLGRSAEVVSIPAGTAVPLMVRRMAPIETMSGLASLELLAPGAENVKVVGFVDWASDSSDYWRASEKYPNPWQSIRPKALGSVQFNLQGARKDVFVGPHKKVEFDYQHGGRFAFIRIGQDAIQAADGGSPLLGNFGAHYLIEGQIGNPTQEDQKVEIVFEASAGYSGAVFLVNGRYVNALLQTKQTITLLEETLRPGQTRSVRIETIPLSGAHYPATITVRPVGTHGG